MFILYTVLFVTVRQAYKHYVYIYKHSIEYIGSIIIIRRADRIDGPMGRRRCYTFVASPLCVCIYTYICLRRPLMPTWNDRHQLGIRPPGFINIDGPLSAIRFSI